MTDWVHRAPPAPTSSVTDAVDTTGTAAGRPICYNDVVQDDPLAGRALVYLDQNHASRLAKYLLGQPGHGDFAPLYGALRRAPVLCPPSPFHVLETRGGYLLPTLQGLFAQLSGDLWVRPWCEVLARQLAEGPGGPGQLLRAGGSWEDGVGLEPLAGLEAESLPAGTFPARARALELLAERLDEPADRLARTPFGRLLARLLALRADDPDRLARDSDLADLVMAATVVPYVDAVGTDRYLRELLLRLGARPRSFSGRRAEVADFTRWLEALPAGAPRDR